MSSRMSTQEAQQILAEFGYPKEPINWQSAVWFPFFPEPTYDHERLPDCLCFLIHKNGLPRALLCLEDSVDEYARIAKDESLFSQPPPYLFTYENGRLSARRLTKEGYISEKGLPYWHELDTAVPGCFSEKRANAEILAVRDSFSKWLKHPYSRKAVETIMRISTRPAAILKELIQNACDCFASEMQFSMQNNILTFRHNGHPFMPSNVHAITALNFSCKSPSAIGYKGIGFKAVYQVCTRPQISCGRFRFAFEPMAEYSVTHSASAIRPYLPVIDSKIPQAPPGWTEFRLPIAPDRCDAIESALRMVESTVILFVAGKGLPLQRIRVLDRVIELQGNLSSTSGLVAISENAEPKRWFYVRHRFVITEDQKFAVDDFITSTGREDVTAPLDEEIVVAVPVVENKDGILLPNRHHKGRFHSFLPTLDEYPYPWDINGNFLLDESRDHLRPPPDPDVSPLNWNATLLRECGRALLSLLDETKIAWSEEVSTIAAYLNLVPNWEEAQNTPQLENHFGIMKDAFFAQFDEKPRVLVYGASGLDFSTPQEATWIDRRLLPLFDFGAWLKLMPPDSKVVCGDLDADVWHPILCGHFGRPTLDGKALIERLTEETWPASLGIEAGSADLVPLIGRLLCYLGDQGVRSDDAGEAWLLLDENRKLHRPRDQQYRKAIYRMLEDRLASLPESMFEEITLAHDGVMRFLQRDPSYFKGDFSESLTDELREKGRKLWTELVAALDFVTIITGWLNPVFVDRLDGEPGILKKRLDWLRFLFQNKDRLQRGDILSELRVRVLARLGREQEVWKAPTEVWLSRVCPQGEDLETFFGDTPEVALLSRKNADILAPDSDADPSELGIFFSKLGVHTSLQYEVLDWYCFSPWSVDDIPRFCTALGITADQIPIQHINQAMRVEDYDFPRDVVLAFDHMIAQGTNPLGRLQRIRSFARLLEASWQKLREGMTQKGFYHICGARVEAHVSGGPSRLRHRLCEAEWVPLVNNPKVLKRPCETCLRTESSPQLVDSATVPNYADIELENEELIKFLRIGTVPQGLTALDAIRSLANNWPNVQDAKSEFEKLYNDLATQLGTEIDLEAAQRAFREEALIFVPTRLPVLRKSTEVLCAANSRFEGYLEDLADFYPARLQELFQWLGVATEVEEIHYLRYLVSYVWKEQPPIDERRRSLILKCYRQLVKWAATVSSTQGIWASPEGKAFCDQILFFGRCVGKPGWYSGREKTIVFRDEAQIEELLATNDKYVLESFLHQLRRTEESLEPFLRMFRVRRASELVTRKVEPRGEVRSLTTTSNFRQNLFRLMDLLGVRLRQHLGLEYSDDAQSDEFFKKVATIRETSKDMGLVSCSALSVVLQEANGNCERGISCDALLEIEGRNATAYIIGQACSEVGPQLARELKQSLRTDVLPDQVMVLVDRLIEDIAGFLDRNPDHFERRMQQVLLRHLPALASATGGGDIDDILAGAVMSVTTSPPKDEQQSPSGESTFRAHKDTIEKQEVGAELTSGEFLMLEIDCQTAVFVKRPSEEFQVFSKELREPRARGRPTGPPRRRLNDKELRKIGRQAELHAFKKEKERLKEAGRPDLAEKVVDRNEAGYDPYGPYDIDSFDQDESGEWKPMMIEVKGHLEGDAYWFDMSEPELRMALSDSSIPYFVYLVLNLAQKEARIEPLDFRKLWREGRIHYQAVKMRMELRHELPDSGSGA